MRLFFVHIFVACSNQVMRMFVIFFALGVASLQQQADLPETYCLWLGLALGLLAMGWRRLTQSPRIIYLALSLSGLALGFVWAAAMAHTRMADALPLANEGIEISMTGVVASLPQTMERGLRFEFDVEASTVPVPSHISLTWNRNPHVELASPRAGERWRCTVRLKRPHGNVNANGMDFEAWLLERDIRATGSVRLSDPHTLERLDELVWRPGYLVERVRQNIRDRFLAALPDAPYGGILVALAIGDQQAIAPDLWQVFSRTGITHLMSISGSHITMLAALAYFLSAWLWRRSSVLPLYVPVQHAAAIGGLAAAFAYCLLAGFAVPAQRTLYMLAVVALANLARREMAPSRVLALALLVVLLYDPWAVLAAGFWLSFGAVALLLLVGSGARERMHWFKEWGRAQWAVTLGMLPALLALFQQFSLVSPLANAIAIPLVGIVITPLAVAATIPVLSMLLPLANWLTELLMWVMQFLAHLPIATWQQAAPPMVLVIAALLGGAWALLPYGFPARWLGILAFIPLLSFSPQRPDTNAVSVTVLDVGQGLAVHVQTARHDLLFDAGPAFSADADSGNRIIVPYLRSIGVRHLDMLIISHADRDHSGGAESVLAMVPVAQIKSSLPFEHPLSAQPIKQTDCVAGEAWEWDSVRFEVLHPDVALIAERVNHVTNDLACVLKISAAGKHLLITSDIEAVGELALVARRDKSLVADVLVVPHHGSRTSSTPEFIAAVGAREAIFPVGYRNSFGHPRADVVARYFATGANLHRTDKDGAVQVSLSNDSVKLVHQRDIARRYWHD